MDKIKLAEEVEQILLDFNENIDTMEEILNNFNVSAVNNILVDLCKKYFDEGLQQEFVESFIDDYPPNDVDDLDELKDIFGDVETSDFVDFLFNDYSYEIAEEFIHKLGINQVEDLYLLGDEIHDYIQDEDLFPDSILDDCYDLLDQYEEEYNKAHIPTVYDLTEYEDEVSDEVIVGEYPDVGMRDGCLVDIDGEVIYDFENKTHSQLLGEYLGNEDVQSYRSDARRQLREEDVNSFTFGHICNNIILIDRPIGMTEKDVIDDIDNSDLDYGKIYIWESDTLEDGTVKRLASKGID